MKKFAGKVFWHLCVGLYRLGTGKWGKLKIQPNKVIASSFGGRKFGDNPLYIYEALRQINPDVDLVWVRHPKEHFSTPPYIRTVNKHTLRYFYEYATAKVWIDNELIHSYMQKKDEQYFVETWHGGIGFKRLYFGVKGYDESNRSYPRLKTTTDLADLFLSNCDFFTDICHKGFRYEGEIMQCGFPRNDAIANEELRKRNADFVRKTLGIGEGTSLLLYVPTFRDGTSDVKDRYDIDFSRLLSALRKRFGGEWRILLRLHPWLQNSPISEQLCSNNDIINVTSYPDVQQLNAVCNACMTDYSSTVFDALLQRIPCFIYANDFDEYERVRGVYFTPEESPFPYSTNNDELERDVLEFDWESYNKALDTFIRDKGLCEPGDASMQVAQRIAAWLSGHK